MTEIVRYEEQVYAGVLGKVIGVYMGRPVEGVSKAHAVARWGLIDRYIHTDVGYDLVGPDDDICGTMTFVRAIEESGRYADVRPEDFGNAWLNYLVENRSFIWWGGLGVSTEHAAYIRLKQGIQPPQSGSIAVNGPTIAQQIGAQIFIDCIGMVTPGDPELAASLARRAACVSHDGEAINGAVVVAGMVSAAFVEKDMARLLDIGAGLIPEDSAIAEVHRNVRQWRQRDDDWHATWERIRERYGPPTYGGVHIVPNHALMVLAWSYAPDDFRESQAIVNTAGWDTDCNGGNVGSVMGIKVGLDRINEAYDFQAPMADRMLLPTAEGCRVASDCLIEALRVARIGRRVMGWQEVPAPKGGVWHHFSLPNSRHGYMVENAYEAPLEEPDRYDRGSTPGTGRTSNVPLRDGSRALAVDFEHVTPGHPVRVSTQAFQTPMRPDYYYHVIGTPRIYPGYSITFRGSVESVERDCVLKPFVRYLAPGGTGVDGLARPLAYGEGVELSAGQQFTLDLVVPPTNGLPVLDVGIEVSGGPYGRGRLLIHSVDYVATPQVSVPDALPLAADGAPRGWFAELNILAKSDAAAPVEVMHFGRNEGRGVLVTGSDDWADYTISGRIAVNVAEGAGLIARYRGLRRYLALVRTREGLRLLLCRDGERVLSETTYEWDREPHTLSLHVQGADVVGSVDGAEVLRGIDDSLHCGGAGYFIERGIANFRETEILALR